MRALVVDLLEEAALEGHTLLPRSWLIRRARERTLQPPCPLGENVLDATEESFGSAVVRAATRTGEAAYQVDGLANCRKIIRREVRGRTKGRPHTASLDWRALVDAGLRQSLPEEAADRDLEERARQEKAAALEQLYRSRLSVLIGPAGTGKTDAPARALLDSRPCHERIVAPGTHRQSARALGGADRATRVGPDTRPVPEPLAALRCRDRRVLPETSCATLR